MLFQFNTDNQIEGNSEMERRVRDIVTERLSDVSERLTRVEVHVAEINGPKGGVDKRCSVELRATGLQPVVATHKAETIEAAATAASDKALTALERRIGKMTTRKGH